MELCDEFMQTNILMMSSPKFYEHLTQYITEILYADIGSIVHDENYDEEDEQNEYDELIEFVAEIVEDFLSTCSIPKRSTHIGTICNPSYSKDVVQKKVETLQSIIQPAQKTKEWYEFRNNLISASNLWKVFGSDAQRNSLIYEKCKPINPENVYAGSVSTSSPLHWGIKYEPITVMIYEKKWKTTIGEFGCIQHPQYSFIGASPDGINVDSDSALFGRMLEIKNIVNREITGIPKQEYWVQTQIQMETCDLDECDFVETRFKEYADDQCFYADNNHEYKGVILHFMSRDLDQLSNTAPTYRYMPLDLPLHQKAIAEWTAGEKDKMKGENRVLFTTIYWYLDEISCVLIHRNREWFQHACPKIQELWEIIEKERIDGYAHRASKKRPRGPSIDLNDPDVLSRTNSSTTICLIKLDENGNVHV